MTAGQAWRDGIGRVASAPTLLAGVWLMTVAASLPLAVALRGQIEQHLGSSLAAQSAVNGVNYEWMQEFADQATSVGTTFGPSVIGFGAVLDNLSAFLDYTRRPVAIVVATGMYLALWLFVAGGVIDRYARNRPTRAHGFFSASGVYFFRFLRLGFVMLVVYAALFTYVHRWLFDVFYPSLTRETTVERTAFLVRLSLYLIFGALVAACNLVFDYAKVRAVVEDRRSMLGAIVAAVRFVRRNVGPAVGLYLLDIALFAATLALYALLAPGAGGASLRAWAGFAIAQLYVAARLAVKLTFWASETSLFQARLAHAGYMAVAAPSWPESPEVEAIAPLQSGHASR